MLRLDKVKKHYKEFELSCSMEVQEGCVTGLIGKNGAGKSTTFKLILGLTYADDGTIEVLGRSYPAGKSIGALEKGQLGVVLADSGFQGCLAIRDLTPMLASMYPGFRKDYFLEKCRDFDLPLNKKVKEFSTGMKRKLQVLTAISHEAKLLLLDEPTNHLDAESVAWLEHHLREYKGTVVMVTHDRYFLDNVTGWILELDRGQGIPYEGNYTSWLEQKQKRIEQEAREENARQKTLANELEWIRKNPKARQAKSKARINAYEELLAESSKEQITQAYINIPMTERLGDMVIEAKNISKAFGERVLIDNLSFKIPKGAIVGIIGPNGAGKTTLFKMITGQEQPDSGEIVMGDTVDLGYVDQSRDELRADKTIWEEISDGLDIIELGKKQMPSRAYVGQFNFKGTDQQKKIGQLSGGERNRVHLAKMLKKGANVILLDEPTNDLDVDTLRSLEEGIMNYPGCVLVTSHDRWFLDRLATHILAYEDEGHVEWFEGNFEDYEKDKIRRLGEEACRPHRVKYKKLER